MMKPIKYFVGANLHKGNNMVSWIHIEDLLRSIEFIINNKAEGIFNLTSPEPIQAKFINTIIAQKLKRPLWFNIPKSIIKIIFGKMTNELILSNQQVLPDHLIKLGFQFKYKSIDKALESLIK